MKGLVKGIIIGAVIAAVGVCVLILGLALNGWKFGKKINFEMQSAEASADNTKIILDVNIGSVKTEFYDGENITIEYPVADGFKSSFTENGGTVTFNGLKRVWYKNWFRSYDVPDTIVKLPAGKSYDIEFEIDAGSAYLADGEYGTLNIDINAGSFNAGSVKCTSLVCDIDAGSVKVIAAECETFRMEINAGSAKIEKLDAKTSDIDVDAGSSAVGFAGAEEDYTVTVRVSAGSTNLGNRTGATDRIINAKISAGKFTASFVN